jgi:hypothetical protein
MNKDEEISVEEDVVEEESDGNQWAELKVSGDEILETVKELIKDAAIRRIVIKNSKKRVLIEIPLVLGLAGIALVPAYAAIALAVALTADCTILVERVERTEDQPEQEQVSE